jgi:[ribosomal protein S18]-alanine N-acetyltransferase
MIEHVPPYKVEPMQWGDVPQVMAIERTAFTLPWSDYTYRHELLENRNAHYFVARRLNGSVLSKSTWLSRLLKFEQKLPIVGYGGFWIVLDEAHISTIASDEQWRGRGIGELLLLAMIERGIELGAHEVTLEVRVTNRVAQSLYRKYGFEVVGQRPGYYRDNNEDADLMTAFKVDQPEYQANLQTLRGSLEERLRREVTRTQLPETSQSM